MKRYFALALVACGIEIVLALALFSDLRKARGNASSIVLFMAVNGAAGVVAVREALRRRDEARSREDEVARAFESIVELPSDVDDALRAIRIRWPDVQPPRVRSSSGSLDGDFDMELDMASLRMTLSGTNKRVLSAQVRAQ